jgi:protein-serine/threonine kinase
MRRPPTEPQLLPDQLAFDNQPEVHDTQRLGSSGNRSVLQKNAKRFTDAYDDDQNYGGKSGSSGAARRVMDLFRRRGKARGEERV